MFHVNGLVLLLGAWGGGCCRVLMVGRSVVLGEGVKDGIGVYCLWVIEVIVSN